MQKRFYEWKTTNGHTMRRVFVIGNYSQSAAAYDALVNEILKDIPDADRANIDLGIVKISDSIKGYALATWYVPDGTTVPASYVRHGDRFDFSW